MSVPIISSIGAGFPAALGTPPIRAGVAAAASFAGLLQDVLDGSGAAPLPMGPPPPPSVVTVPQPYALPGLVVAGVIPYLAERREPAKRQAAKPQRRPPRR